MIDVNDYIHNQSYGYIVVDDGDIHEDLLLNLAYDDLKLLAIIKIARYDRSLESSLRYAYSDYIDDDTPIIMIEPDHLNNETIKQIIKTISK